MEYRTDVWWLLYCAAGSDRLPADVFAFWLKLSQRVHWKDSISHSVLDPFGCCVLTWMMGC